MASAPASIWTVGNKIESHYLYTTTTIWKYGIIRTFLAELPVSETVHARFRALCR